MAARDDLRRSAVAGAPARLVKLSCPYNVLHSIVRPTTDADMLWTSIPASFRGLARLLKPRNGAVDTPRSMASSCVASEPAFLSTRPEGPVVSLQAARTAAARKAAAKGRRRFTNDNLMI